MIDFINRLIGDIKKIKSINKKTIEGDVFGNFLIETKSSSGIISNIRKNQLAVFDLVIYTDKLKNRNYRSSKKYINKSYSK